MNNTIHTFCLTALLTTLALATPVSSMEAQAEPERLQAHLVQSQATRQTAVAEFSVSKATIEACLEQVKGKTGLGYLYNGTESLDKTGSVTVSLRNTTVGEILDNIFSDGQFTYEIANGVILIKKAVAKTLPKTAPDKAASSGGHGSVSVTVKVTDPGDGQPVAGAACLFTDYGIYGITDENGKCVLNKVPTGEANLNVQMLGYEDFNQKMALNTDRTVNVALKLSSLELEEVTVVAKASAAGSSTSSNIGRMAMDHLQATSLKDVMQLIPGQLMTGAADLTSEEKITIRTLSSSTSNNAFGTSVLIDGIPVSDNASLSDKVGGTSGGTGVDLRQIAADNIESVEVIRGIPSAEYGDLTSGAVIVNTKAGYTPFEIRAKINPTTLNASIGKGWKFSKNGGSMNASLDYANANGDPRTKNRSFDRVNGDVTYSNTFGRIWYTTTKLSFSDLIDLRTTDPDVEVEGTETTQKQYSLRFSHTGKISFNKLLSRTFNYAVGFSMTNSDSWTSSIVSADGGQAIINSLVSGYYQVPYLTNSYRAEGGTVSRPRTLYAKVGNVFTANAKHIRQRFNMGAEYRLEGNTGKGYYNASDSLPLRPNSNGRPRPYYDIPSLNQVSAFFEDNIDWKIAGRMDFKLQAGIRYDMLQPGLPEQVSSFSPRLNASLRVTDWFTLRGGWGQNSKTPGLEYLYPENKYMDRIAASYLPSDESWQMVVYNTYVTEVERNNMLKNATNTKTELGFDLNFKNGMSLSVVGYNDYMANGFGSFSEYKIYYANYYTTAQGINVGSDGKAVIDWKNPARIDTVFTTTGRIGNTQASLDRGVEFDCDLGSIKPIRTTVYLSGAYMETQTWTTGPNYSSPSGIPATSAYALGGVNTPPFKLLYPSGLQKDINRRFSTMLRLVCNIPRMKMVASLSNQVIWYSYQHTTNQKSDPVAWIDTDLTYHEITRAMLDNPAYTIKGVSLAAQRKNPADSDPIVQKPIWLMNLRLTKDVSRNFGFSFFVNNALFYMPYQSSSYSGTLTERNTGTFSFGMELYVKI
jgi:outer membrane receptor protein involved in Fe transport